MYPGKHAQDHPERPAVIMAGSGEKVTYRELDDRSNQLAQLMWQAGLRPGDGVCILMENHPRYFESYWGAVRSGLYFTTINRYLTAEEAAYIVNDSGAKVLISSRALADVASEILPLVPDTPIRLMVDGAVEGFEPYEEAIAAHPAEPLEHQPRGEAMLYSSGTTGRPKGIKRPLSGQNVDEDPGAVVLLLQGLFGVDGDTRYLSPAPMYHSAPLGFTTGVQSLGGTAVVMEKFDPVDAIAYLGSHDITHSQWVPTMFTRMLKLDPAERAKLDAPRHKVAIHAAAPCPVEVKRQMIEWWGPILYEYYAGTEVNGFVFCNSEQWLAHPGTVGQAILGVIHICDDEGNELPNGEPGTIYFEREAMPFEYHNDPEKTKGAQHPEHPNWSTLGDVGYLDDDGFLYLTDRKSFMIISGGVNIYPQEIEDVMVMHPKIADVAVFGVPNEEMGEEVKAVVQLAPGTEGTPELATELLGWTRQNIAHYKAPRSIDFTDELPRLPTGKLYKRILRDAYWGNTNSRIV
jgi:long-chain acyl-CoA synthetase